MVIKCDNLKEALVEDFTKLLSFLTRLKKQKELLNSFYKQSIGDVNDGNVIGSAAKWKHNVT